MVDLPFDVDDPRLAAAAWSRVAEPPDQHAGALVDNLGATEALGWLTAVAAGRVDPGGEPWVRAVAGWVPRLENLDIRRELDTLDRLGGRLVLPGDPDWPTPLDDLGVERPLALWVRGGAIVQGRAVALVGARACTSYGEHVAADMAVGLAEAGTTVVSGGAYGIDAAAHRGTLGVDGVTTAVLAGGVDRLYPVGNTRLLEAVTTSGAVVSEVPPGSVPSRNRFLARNRLIAALGAATVVVEAAWRSGALSTASRAAQLSRPVGAVPGPVTSMASAGCHRLMREQGAVCVTEAAEVLELVGVAGEHLTDDDRPVPAGLLDDLDPAARRVLDALPLRGSAPVTNVARAAGLPATEVRAALGHLELAGRARRTGSTWARSR
ncbi:DNA protecting protein DprA [Georgenia soli]|uniref:DNA protecting protein DprA n=1 Tax=Georgenia soli TaxID=638953 RepID=A0A2A9EHV0_9MICO|nr:DNA-processing protein DprA [Georgenia soli]PFG38494.1 DNA protecting protein DprA [Georgenia soli]